MSGAAGRPPADLLQEGMIRLGLDAAVLERGWEETLRLLEAYRREVELWNPRYKLTAASEEGLIIKHFLDSLAPWRELFQPADSAGMPEGAEVLDLGSGGGFPGIPLSICFPRYQYRLVEKSGKRIRFLRNVCRMLRLEKTEPVQADYRESGELGELVVFRAVTPLDSGAGEDMLRLVRPGGRAAAYKGRRDKAEAELAALAGKVEGRVVPVDVPFLEEERCLTLFSRPVPR